jgi:hypothetical protein
MTSGLTIEIVWFDEDVVELLVSGSNGVFSGAARLYADREGLKKLSVFLKGFPQEPDERRLIEMGTFDPGFSGGGARLGLRCTDSAGHVALDVLLATQVENNRHQRVEFALQTEPAALDRFHTQVEALEIRVGARAELSVH